MMKPIKESDVSFRVICQPETDPFEGFGTEARKLWIRDQLERGNDWAWCTVIVEGRWLGLRAEASLHHGSYLSRESFLESDTAYPEMRMFCVHQLERMRQAIVDG